MSGVLILANALESILSDGAFGLMVGLFLADRWLAQWEDVHVHPGIFSVPPLQMLPICGVAFAVCDLFRPWILAASMSGSLHIAPTLALVPEVLLSTHQGTIWFIQSGAIAVFLLALILMKANRSRPRSATLMVCFVVLSFSKAVSGHAGDNGDFTWAASLQTLHILATAVWSGAVSVSGLLIVPRLVKLSSSSAAFNYARILSRSAAAALAVLAGSGIFAAWRETDGSFSALRASTWGWVLIVKVALVMVAVGIGATNRFVCLGGAESDYKISLLRRMLAFEAVILILVIALSGLLGSLSPPGMS